MSKEGLKADESKLEAIKKIPKPNNKAELESILGMLNFLSSYAPKLSELSAPLCELTRQNVIFYWDKTMDCVFEKVKDVITKSPALAYFDQ